MGAAGLGQHRTPNRRLACTPLGSWGAGLASTRGRATTGRRSTSWRYERRCLLERGLVTFLTGLLCRLVSWFGTVDPRGGRCGPGPGRRAPLLVGRRRRLQAPCAQALSAFAGGPCNALYRNHVVGLQWSVQVWDSCELECAWCCLRKVVDAHLRRPVWRRRVEDRIAVVPRPRGVRRWPSIAFLRLRWRLRQRAWPISRSGVMVRAAANFLPACDKPAHAHPVVPC